MKLSKLHYVADYAHFLKCNDTAKYIIASDTNQKINSENLGERGNGHDIHGLEAQRTHSEGLEPSK